MAVSICDPAACPTVRPVVEMRLALKAAHQPARRTQTAKTSHQPWWTVRTRACPPTHVHMLGMSRRAFTHTDTHVIHAYTSIVYIQYTQIYTSRQNYCGGLDDKRHPLARVLEHLALVGDAVWEGHGTLSAWNLAEEVGHDGRAVKPYSPALLPFHSLGFLCDET